MGRKPVWTSVYATARTCRLSFRDGKVLCRQTGQLCSTFSATVYRIWRNPSASSVWKMRIQKSTCSLPQIRLCTCSCCLSLRRVCCLSLPTLSVLSATNQMLPRLRNRLRNPVFDKRVPTWKLFFKFVNFDVIWMFVMPWSGFLNAESHNLQQFPHMNITIFHHVFSSDIFSNFFCGPQATPVSWRPSSFQMPHQTFALF